MQELLIEFSSEPCYLNLDSDLRKYGELISTSDDFNGGSLTTVKCRHLDVLLGFFLFGLLFSFFQGIQGF